MVEQSMITTALKEYSVTDAVIAKYKQEYMALTVKGIDDKNGYDICHTARMEIKGKRVEVEKTRKKLKEDSLEYGRAVDKEAKRITALLEPIEEHLTAQEKIIDDELERKRQALINAKLEEEAAAKKAEEDRIAKVRADQEAEALRLATISKEQSEREAKIKEAEAAIEREKQRVIDEEIARKKKIQDEKDKAEAEKKRKEELEKAKKEAAEKALKDAEERRIKEEKAKAAQIEKDRIAAEKKAQRAPDKIKLLHYSDAIMDISPIELKSEEAILIFNEFHATLVKIDTILRDKAEAL